MRDIRTGIRSRRRRVGCACFCDDGEETPLEGDGGVEAGEGEAGPQGAGVARRAAGLPGGQADKAVGLRRNGVVRPPARNPTNPAEATLSVVGSDSLRSNLSGGMPARTDLLSLAEAVVGGLAIAGKLVVNGLVRQAFRMPTVDKNCVRGDFGGSASNTPSPSSSSAESDRVSGAGGKSRRHNGQRNRRQLSSVAQQ